MSSFICMNKAIKFGLHSVAGVEEGCGGMSGAAVR
jgi:hypothetical protein